jgi:site-specific DNA-cytosine methylase
MIVYELFPCSGGMAEGLRRAGIDVTMAFDRDPDAIASYTRNLGHAPAQIDVRDLLRMVAAGWSPGPIDLLVADPPCAPWSRAGKRRGTRDERDMLTVTVELVRRLRPRAYLIANVPGLDDEPNWPIVQATIGALSEVGYCSNDFVQLDAADFGVPQHRVRPFWYGHLDGPCVQWPSRTHGSPEECRHPALLGEALRPWVTCRQALGHLSGQLGSPVRLRWRGQNGKQQGSVPDRPARVVGTSNLSDGNVLTHPGASARRAHVPSRRPRATPIDAPSGTVTTTPNGNGGIIYPPELVGRERSDGSLRESRVDAPAHTIRGSRSSSERLIVSGAHQTSRADRPARTLTTNKYGDGALADLQASGRHPPSAVDEPAKVVPSSQPGNGGVGAPRKRPPPPEHTRRAVGDAGGDGGRRERALPPTLAAGRARARRDPRAMARAATSPRVAVGPPVDDDPARRPDPAAGSPLRILDALDAERHQALGEGRGDPAGLSGRLALRRQDEGVALEPDRPGDAAGARACGRTSHRRRDARWRGAGGVVSARRFAQDTTVPAEKSRAELDAILGRNGASQRGIMHDEAQGLAIVVFALEGRQYRLSVPMPERAWPEPDDEPSGWWKWPVEKRETWVRARHEQAMRQRWRALLLLVKAKLEIVAMGVSSFEREFLADLVLPDGHTAHETIGPYMAALVQNGYQAPLALPEARRGAP